MRQLGRWLRRIDDVVEYLVKCALDRLGRRPRRAMLALAALGLAAWLRPGTRPDDPGPAAPDGEVDLTDSILAAGIELDGPVFPDCRHVFGRKDGPARFEVEEVRIDEGVTGYWRATIRLGNRTHRAGPGDVLPSREEPELVVIGVGSSWVRALDLGTLEIVLRRQRGECPDGDLEAQVIAIAGEAPNWVAVLEYLGETHIVQSGDHVPGETRAGLVVQDIGPYHVGVRRMATGETVTLFLPLPALSDLPDLEGISIPDR